MYNIKKQFQGWVAFSSQGDRIALTQIEQVINGKYVKLGYYDTQDDNLTWFDKEKWIGEYYNKCILYVFKEICFHVNQLKNHEILNKHISTCYCYMMYVTIILS